MTSLTRNCVTANRNSGSSCWNPRDAATCYRAMRVSQISRVACPLAANRMSLARHSRGNNPHHNAYSRTIRPWLSSQPGSKAPGTSQASVCSLRYCTISYRRQRHLYRFVRVCLSAYLPDCLLACLSVCLSGWMDMAKRFYIPAIYDQTSS